MAPAPTRPRRARRVRVEARAKLNLGLAVGPRRCDGFHDLATVFQSVSLADTLMAEPSRAGFRLRVRFENAALRGRPARAELARVPMRADNLVLRAARLVAARCGFAGGVRFTLIKRIPTRSGLGGGSADAAAAIAAINVLYELGLPLRERLALALELGSDVPFAVRGGTALGLSRGERLARLRLKRPFRALIAVPRWGVLTPRAFARIDRGKYGLTAWRTKLRFARNFRRKRLIPEQALRLGNTLESVLGNRKPSFLYLCRRLHDAGVPSVHMTGSGSAVFGLLTPGTTFQNVTNRFVGSEALFGVHSCGAGLRVSTR